MLFRSNDTATTETYTRRNTLSLHDALPISMAPQDPSIVAIAADRPVADRRLPWFHRDDIAAIADFIAALRQR